MKKRKNKMLFLSFFMISCVLLGIVSHAKFKENGIKADGLEFYIHADQENVSKGDEVKFNLEIKKQMIDNYIFLSTSNDFELNKEELKSKNLEIIKDIEESEKGIKLVFNDEVNYPLTLEFQGMAIMSGTTIVNAFDNIGNKADLKFEVMEEASKNKPDTVVEESSDKESDTVVEESSDKESDTVVEEESNDLKVDEDKLGVSGELDNKNSEDSDVASYVSGPLLPPDMKLRDDPSVTPVSENATIEGSEDAMIMNRGPNSVASLYKNNQFVRVARSRENITNADSGEGTYIYYTNSGMYKGKSVDVKQTILSSGSGSSSGHEAEKDRGSLYGTNQPDGLRPSNMLTVSPRAQVPEEHDNSMRVEFFDSKTKEPVKVKGIWTAFNIQTSSRISFVSDSIENIYVNEKSELLGYKKTENSREKLVIEDSAPNAGGGPASSPRMKTTFVYGETYSIDIDMFNDRTSDSGYFGFESKPIVNFGIKKPIKTGKTISQEDKTVEYKTSVFVPAIEGGKYFSNLTINDPLIKELSVNSVDIIDVATGLSAKDKFGMLGIGTTAMATAKDTTLRTPSFYNKFYEFRVNATVKKNADLSKFKYENGYRMLPNTSSLSYSYSSNDQKVLYSNVAYAPIEEKGFQVEETVKHMDGSVAEKASPSDELIYRATVLSSFEEEDEEVNYESIKLNTTIDDSLDSVDSIVLKDESGEVIGKGNYNSETRTISAENTKPINREKNVYLEYSTKIKNVSSGTTITAKTDVEVKYEEITTKYSGVSNEVKTIVESPGILVEEVTHTDGSNAEFAEPDDTLHYKMTYETPYVGEIGSKNTYKNIYFESDIKEINDNTKDLRNLTARTETGIKLADSIVSDDKLIAQDNTNKIASNEKIIIEFDVTVDSDKVSEDSVISNQSSINLQFSDGSIFDGVQGNLVKTKIEGLTSKLTLDFAPELDFGTATISSEDRNYYAKVQNVEENIVKKEVPNYVQITDKRRNSDGWSLSVKQNGQFQSEKNKKALIGAEILFKNGHLESQSSSVKPSIIEETFTLIPDDTGASKNIIQAKSGEGIGTWSYNSGDIGNMKESIELKVPGSSVKYLDTYKTSLTWMLTNTP